MMRVVPTTPEPAAGAGPDPVPLLLRDLVHDRTGIFFERTDAMLEKMESRLRELKNPPLLDYYYLLKYDAQGTAEWRRLMDAFSVQETYFWREPDQIRALVDHLVPRWFRAAPSTPLRVWSAACATGEEPYSVAIALEEAGWGAHPIEIIASDASEGALARARRRLFRERSFRSLPNDLREKYFTPRGEMQELRPEIAARVAFHWANLVNLDTFPESAEANVIFCRNVFIYFSLASIKRVVASFARRLPPGGSLFVGASESLLKLTTQ